MWKKRLRLGFGVVLLIAAFLYVLPSRRDRIILRAVHMIEDHRTALDALSTKALGVRSKEKRDNVVLFPSEFGEVRAPPVELLDSCEYRIGIGSIGLIPGGTAFCIVKIIDAERALASVKGSDKRFIFLDGSYALLEWK